MKTNNFLKGLATVALLFSTMNSLHAQGAGQILVGGTDFEPSVPSAGKAYVGTNEIKMTGIMGGVIKLNGTQPSKATDLDYDYSTSKDNKGEAIASHFLDGEFMAITGNPIQLDSLHYVDDKTGNWGVVWSRVKGTGSGNVNVLNYNVNGLAPNSAVTLVIKYRSVITADASKNLLKCEMSGQQQVAFKVAANTDDANRYLGQDAPQIKVGTEGVYTYDKATADAEGNYFVNVNWTNQYMDKDCASLQITSIEVYGSIDPQIYSEDGESICAGEIANVKAKGVFQGATYQWYEGGKAITGATSPNYSFETPSGEKTYELQLKVTYGGKTFSSNTVKLKTEKCCEIINEAGVSVPASRKIVFMDDFGEFDLSDPTGKTYKVWDYSDIKDPKQVTKTTTAPFRYALDEPPLGCLFKAYGVQNPGFDVSGIQDGEYCVAGVLTGYNGPYKGMKGAQLEWAGDLHGIKLASGMHYDHSGKPEGCCLFINCKAKTGGQNIYERNITNLCQNRQLFFECYISIFTSSAAGAYNPVDVTVRLTEIGNNSNVIEQRATQTLPSAGGTGDWVKISGQIFLELNDAVKLEIVNNQNTDQNGNDLVLDDIIIRACAAPSLQSYFDLTTFETDTVTCNNGDNLITIFAKPSEMLTNYFGGTANTRFLYQWSTTPDVKTSWRNIADMTEDQKMKVGNKPFVGLNDGDVVYFRSIAGNKSTIGSTAEDAFNADDPCASYTISDPIACVISCPTCTEPLPVKISSSKDVETDDKVYLCYGEKTTLSTNDIVPDKTTWASSDFSGYTFQWSVDGVEDPTMGIEGSNTSSKAKDFEITNDTELSADVEHEYSVLAFDNNYPTQPSCQTEDKITVVLLARPTADPISMEFCEGKPATTDVLPSDDADYTISYYKDALATVSCDAPVLASLTAGTYKYYYTKTSKKGCESEAAAIDIVVNAIPTYTVPAIEPFCAGQSTETSLPATIADSTITWTPSNPSLNDLEGKTTPYSYSYVVTSPEGCESESKNYTVTVLPSAKVTLTATPSCSGTEVVAKIEPSGATAVWSGVATAEKTTFKFGVDTEGDLIVTVPKTDDYCEHADTVAIELWPTPATPTVQNLTYLKKQTPFADLMSHPSGAAASLDKTDPNNTGATLSWTAKSPVSWSSTVPTPTVKNADDPETETLYYSVKSVNEHGCESEPADIKVELFGAPVPKTRDTAFCQNETSATFDQFIKADESLDPTDSYTVNIYSDAALTNKVDYTSAPSTATVGKTTYYATQVGKGGESKPVSFIVNTIGVKEPLVAETNITKCNTDAVQTLVATPNVDEANSYMSNGVIWSSDGGSTFSSEAPVTSTTVGVYTYSAKQSYKIPNTNTTCVGDVVDVTVTIDETTTPAPLSVTYVLSDAEKSGSFADVISQFVANGQTNPLETGYTYEFTGILDSPTATGSFSSTVPTPSVPSKSEVDGGSITKYVSYRRTKQTGGKCVSETATITITISDSPMPETPAISFCEGETISSLDNYVKISTGKKTADKYELRWFGTTKPTSSADEGSTTVSAAPSTTISDPSAPVVYNYYVAQKDLETKAIGSASTLVITVYPKPVQVITPADAECEASVNLANQVSISNTSAFGGASATTEFYTDAAGSDVMSPATATKQGDYYAKSYYSTPNATISGSVCASAVEKIQVVIPTLEFSATDSAQTCPNLEAILSATAKTNVDKVTFTWAGGSDVKSDEQSVSGGEASSKFTTALLAGSAGDEYKYNLTVTAGKCTKEKLGIIVTLGDGPVEGEISLMESSNNESPKTYRDGNTTEPFYTCGGSITAQLGLRKTEGDFSWSNGQTGETVNLTEPGVYTITYVNKCATSVSFTVKDASIKNNAFTIASATETKAEGEELRVCAGEDVKFNLDFTAAEPTTITWTLEDKSTSLISEKGVAMNNAQPSASGEYAYTITSHGCVKTGSASLKVKPYVEFAPMQKLYVVERGKQVDIKNVISVPMTGTPSTITWFENKKGTNVNNTSKDYSFTVEDDCDFTITMSDNDYCESQNTVQVIRDASLKLSADIQSRMCRGDKDVMLLVDTTGTGKFYYKNDWSLVVYQISGGNKIALTDYSAEPGTGILKYPVSPAADASYEVNFIYRLGDKDEQKANASASIVVLQPIEMEMPKGLSICGGSELDINLVKVEPAGVIVNWEEDPSIISATNDTEMITIIPEYSEEDGTNHKMVKRYNLVASYDGCADKADYVDVTVVEPITGTLDGDTICEGTSTILSAASYQADTWTWKLNGEVVGNGQTLNLSPEETAEYYVVMTRGEGVCVDSASTYVFVNSNPVIYSKDSLGYRSVRINLDYSYGTSPYEYMVKGIDEWQSSNVFDSLSYHKHEVYVRDAVGCMDTFEFSILPPSIKIPNWFSPEGDGMFDRWEVPSLAETYPNAEVKIFDRWGKLIAEFLGSDLSWDGKYNGVDMPSTDYWYEIHVRELDKIFTGHFTLIRR